MTTVGGRGGLEPVVRELVQEFDGTFSPGTIRRFVEESHALIARRLAPGTPAVPGPSTSAASAGSAGSAAPGTSGASGAFGRPNPRLSGLTRRLAAERLGALARTEHLVPRTVPEVLFVCVRNSGRSQMAAALLQRYAGDRVIVHSAGSEPGTEIQPTVAAAMSEIGLALVDAYPKPLTDEAVRAADVVVTMGCGDSCPVLPGKLYLDWPLPDPADGDLDLARDVRAEIDGRVRGLWATLEGSPDGVQGPRADGDRGLPGRTQGP